MSFVGYECDICGGTTGPAPVMYGCESGCGNVAVRLDFASVTKAGIEAGADQSMWRYASLLPVVAPPVSTGALRSVGGTPLLRADRVADRFGLATVWLKDEGRMPTGSLKDRASAVVVQRAIEIGARRVVTASTGNAGVALAAMACAAGLEAVILLPESAPRAKIAQLMVFGARLALVRGTYDDAFLLAARATEELGWYCRNTGMNPFTVEGKKTVAYEICEQLGWRAPDRIFVPVGDGNILVAVHKGLSELLELGFIDRMPKLMGVQAEGSSPIARAFEAGVDEIAPVQAHTLADSISAGRPADGRRALAAVRETEGLFLTVSDAQILQAIVDLGRDAAVFAEPAAAAAHAGLRAAVARGVVGPREEVVVLVTGTGLKDVDAAMKATGAPPRVIEPNLDALRGAMGED